MSFAVAGSAASRAAEGPILGHTVLGSGPEHVLVLHDWIGNAGNYDAVAPLLDGSTFTYVFADLRGYGRSRALTGAYTAQEAADDAFRLADSLGWDRFHVVGHSMTGMVVQRMAIDDWVSGRKRLRSVVAATPIAANANVLDADATAFVTAVVHNAELTAQYAALITGGHATPAFIRSMAERQIGENAAEAMQGFRVMWSQTDFSAEAAAAKVGTPILVIGGRLDLPVFGEDNLRATFGAWYPDVEFRFIADAGHYVMVEAPLYFAFLVEDFLRRHE